MSFKGSPLKGFHESEGLNIDFKARRISLRGKEVKPLELDRKIVKFLVGICPLRPNKNPAKSFSSTNIMKMSR